MVFKSVLEWWWIPLIQAFEGRGRQMFESSRIPRSIEQGLEHPEIHTKTRIEKKKAAAGAQE